MATLPMVQRFATEEPEIAEKNSTEANGRNTKTTGNVHPRLARL